MHLSVLGPSITGDPALALQLAAVPCVQATSMLIPAAQCVEKLPSASVAFVFSVMVPFHPAVATTLLPGAITKPNPAAGSVVRVYLQGTGARWGVSIACKLVLTH